MSNKMYNYTESDLRAFGESELIIYILQLQDKLNSINKVIRSK